MSKELHKAILRRLRLRNIFPKHRPDTNKNTTAPKEISVKYYWKTLRTFILKILTLKKVADNISFWGITLFTQNSSKGEKIKLADNGKTTKT